MKVALFNVKYSPNLGDGLLSECTELELHRAGIDAVSIDLAGRTGYAPGNASRGRMLAVLEGMPAPLRRVATRTILSALAAIRLRPAFRRQLVDCDAVVVGGGNLFSDSDLNFPVKIHAALSEAVNLPAAVFAVGVARNWSATGRRLFADGLRNATMVYATVRDERSREIWDDLLPAPIPRAGLVRDPGLLASRHYPRGPASADHRSVGLCITDPLALRYHGHDTDAGDMAHWYGGVATALAQAGWTVGLFTNGSPEDRAYLNRNAADWIAAAAPTHITRIADFATPGDLATFISSCDLMVAHRMHACIAAHSFAVPTILLKWDPKLESFAEIAGRSAYFVDPATITPTALAELAARAEQAGVDRAACTALIDAAASDVAALARALRAAVAARS